MSASELVSAGAAQGQCLCGAVRFEITLPTQWCAHCHCSMCRRAHGAGVVTWVGVNNQQFTILEGEDELVHYASSRQATRSFCRQCGSTLFFRGDRWPGEIHVVLANIDTPIDRNPQAHVYADVAVPWLTLGDDLPHLGGPSGNEALK